LIEPEDEAGGECYCGQEGVSASVVSGVDAAPVLEAGEHVLDTMALAIKRAVVRNECLAVIFEGMQGVMPRAASAFGNQSAS
jgi:hypothetical protein